MSLARKVRKSFFMVLLMSLLMLVYLGLQGEAIAAPTARAIISDPSGTLPLMGEVSFTETTGGLEFEATFRNAPPGEHGIHVHQEGSCADNGNAAGGHFNPDGVQHGYLPVDGFAAAHAGDLGNLYVNEGGTGYLSLTVPGLSLTDGKYAIANRAMILHAQKDDFSQPTGNAGGRIGCGVLTVEQ